MIHTKTALKQSLPKSLKVKINREKKMVNQVSQDKLKGQWQSLNMESSKTASSAKIIHYM